MPDNTVKVSRPGPWGNPFVVGVDGSQAQCVGLFEAMLEIGPCLTGSPTVEEQRAYRAHLTAHLHELRGKHLACWCRPGTPCHADVLLRLANEGSHA
jgi:hypothetical protein